MAGGGGGSTARGDRPVTGGSATQFDYVVRDDRGRKQEGVLDAEDERAAARALQEQGHFVLTLKRTPVAREEFRWSLIAYAMRPISARNMGIFWRMVESTLHAGLTVFDSLARIERDLHETRLRQALRGIAPRVAEGGRLSAALAANPECFPAHVRELVGVGEENGCLEEMASEIANAYERDDRISRSLRWPTWLLLSALLPVPFVWRFFSFIEYLGLFIVTPEKVQPSPGGPWAGATAMWLEKDGPAFLAMLLLMLLGIVAVRLLVRFPGRLAWRDAVALRLPHWGPLARSCAQVRFLRALHAAHRAGQPHAEALTMAGAAAANTVFQRRVQPQIERVRAGGKLGDTLRAAEILPPEVVGALAQGEDTGRLEEALERSATALELDQENAVRAALARSWIAAIFWAFALPAFAGAHLLSQYYDWMFRFTDALAE